MNIISDSCIGAYLYRDCFKIGYNNPFCWSIIGLYSFCKLSKVLFEPYSDKEEINDAKKIANSKLL